MQTAQERLVHLLDGFMTIEEVAECTGLLPRTLRGRVQRGRIAAVHVGSCIMIGRGEVERILAERETKAG
jgi:excisionase family DNA binding protein